MKSALKLVGYIIAFLLMAAGLVAIVLYIMGMGTDDFEIITTMPPTVTETPSPTPTAAPTPTPFIEVTPTPPPSHPLPSLHLLPHPLPSLPVSLWGAISSALTPGFT